MRPAIISPDLSYAWVILLGILGITLFVWFRRSAAGKGLTPFESIGSFLLCGAMATITFNGIRVSEHMMLADVLLLLAAPLILPRLLQTRTPRRVVPTWLILSGGAIIFLGGLSALVSLASGSAQLSTITEDLVVTFRFAFALAGLPILLAVASTSWPRLRSIARLWLWGAGLNAGVAIFDFLSGSSMGPLLTGIHAWGDRFGGLTTHPNHLGLICAMALPVALAESGLPTKRWRRTANVALIACLAMGVLVSGSRAALLAAGLGLILQSVLKRPGFGFWRIAFAPGLAALFIIPTVTYYDLSGNDLLIGLHRLMDRSYDPSTATRLYFYRQAISDILRRPLLGVGMHEMRHAHDIYLQLLQSGGAGMFGVFCIYVMAACGTGWRLARTKRLPQSPRDLAGALEISTIVWLAAGVTQNMIYNRYLYLPIGLVLGLRAVKDAGVGTRRSLRIGLWQAVDETRALVFRSSREMG